MGIIAALKKRYKYMYLKDVLDFYELDGEAKNQKKDQGRRLRRGAARVLYGNPAHLLDVVSYVKDAWDSVSQTSIKNAFVKAELMNLKPKLEAGNEVDDLCTEFSKAMESLNLFVNPLELENFVHIDDEDNEEYAIVVLEDVEELLETMKIAKMAMDDDSDVNTQKLNVGLENGVIFQGFDSLYKQVLDIDDQLLYPEVQTKVEETFDDLKKSFESFQSKIRTVGLKAKCKKLQNLRQMTIHDMFN
jgi:hypothetical protein